MLEEVVLEFAEEGDKYITCVNTCENESFNNLITLYAPKGIHFGSTYDLLVALAILHHNCGKQTFMKDTFTEVLQASEHPKHFQGFPTTLDEDLVVNVEDLPVQLRPKTLFCEMCLSSQQ